MKVPRPICVNVSLTHIGLPLWPVLVHLLLAAAQYISSYTSGNKEGKGLPVDQAHSCYGTVPDVIVM